MLLSMRNYEAAYVRGDFRWRSITSITKAASEEGGGYSMGRWKRGPLAGTRCATGRPRGGAGSEDDRGIGKRAKALYRIDARGETCRAQAGCQKHEREEQSLPTDTWPRLLSRISSAHYAGVRLRSCRI